MCKAIREMEQIYTKKGEEFGKDTYKNWRKIKAPFYENSVIKS